MERLEQSIQEADKALYRAKTSGKNRTVLAAVGKSLTQIIQKTTNSLAEV